MRAHQTVLNKSPVWNFRIPLSWAFGILFLIILWTSGRLGKLQSGCGRMVTMNPRCCSCAKRGPDKVPSIRSRSKSLTPSVLPRKMYRTICITLGEMMLEMRDGNQLVLRDVGEEGESRRRPSSHIPRRFGLQLRSRGMRGTAFKSIVVNGM